MTTEHLPNISPSLRRTGSSPMHHACGPALQLVNHRSLFGTQLLPHRSPFSARPVSHRRHAAPTSVRYYAAKRIEEEAEERLRRSPASKVHHRHSWLTRWQIDQYSRNDLCREATEISANRRKPLSARLQRLWCSPSGHHSPNGNRRTRTTTTVVRTGMSPLSGAFLRQHHYRSKGSGHVIHV